MPIFGDVTFSILAVFYNFARSYDARMMIIYFFAAAASHAFMSNDYFKRRWPRPLAHGICVIDYDVIDLNVTSLLSSARLFYGLPFLSWTVTIKFLRLQQQNYTGIVIFKHFRIFAFLRSLFNEHFIQVSADFSFYLGLVSKLLIAYRILFGSACVSIF